MLTHVGYQQVSVPQCCPRLQRRVSPLGTAAQGSRWGCRMTTGHRANRRSLTLVCSWEAFHRQLRVAAPSLCSMHCRAAPTAPPAPTSSTVFPPAWHQASRSAALGCKGTSTRLRWSIYMNSPRLYQATHYQSPPEELAKWLTTGQHRVPAQPQRLWCYGQTLSEPMR